MERPKLRPTVTITTYSASSSSFKSGASKQSRRKLQQESQEQLDIQKEKTGATKSEFSTEFFSKFRSQVRGLHAFARSPLVDLSQIKGPTGSIRGHKDVVRKSLEGIKVAHHRRMTSLCTFQGPEAAMQQQGQGNLLRSFQDFSIISSSSMMTSGVRQKHMLSLQSMDELYCSEYLERLLDEEQDQCVAYTTSLGVIRRTFDDSKVMKSILNLNLINFEERDIFLNQEYKHQLRMRLNSIVVPALFVDGKHIGGLKELEVMNENGELMKRLSKFKMSTARKGVCLCCGNARFIACQSCNGSRKSTIHHFKFNSIALRCIRCDKNDGLIQCPVCSQATLVEDECEQALDQNNNSADQGSGSVGCYQNGADSNC